MTSLRSSVCVTLILMSSAVLGLSACNKPAATGSEGSSVAPAASGSEAVAVAPATGGTTDMGPGLKTGLWEMTSNIPGMTKPMSTKMCLDAGLSNRFEKMGSSNPGKLDCKTQSASRVGSTVDVATVCTTQGMKVNTRMHMELVGDTAYHQTVEMTYDPPIAGRGAMTTTVDGKWLGDCTADMKAGDMVMAGGHKINMYDVAAKGKAH